MFGSYWTKKRSGRKVSRRGSSKWFSLFKFLLYLLVFSEKTLTYDKLFTDSKLFLDKIQFLELDVAKKQQEKEILQTDLTKLREESLATCSENSKLKFSLEDLEFKFKRQKNTLEDVENSLTESKVFFFFFFLLN